MQITLYDASWHSFGGGEKFICAAADVLAQAGNDVTLLLDRPSVTLERLAGYFNLPLTGVRAKICTRHDVHAHLTGSDLAIIMSNVHSLGLPGRTTAYILQIPYAPITPATMADKAARGDIREAAKDLFRRRLLADARRADLVMVYSLFVQQTLQRAHAINAKVVYPPIDDFGSSVPKEQVILSVGRFFTGLYNDKRYDVMIDAFKRLYDRIPGSPWEYHLVGSCADDRASLRHLASLRERARGYPVKFFVNASFEEVRARYRAATIFWHAAGYGVDEARHPDRTEHFGMSTVEAMSASCVPVVVNRGGQKEIVSQGKSGYLWDSPEQLVEWSLSLIHDREAARQLALHARERFRNFSFDRFSSTLLSCIQGRPPGNHGKIS